MRCTVCVLLVLCWLVWLAGCTTTKPIELPIPAPCIEKIPAKPDRCEPKDKTRQEYLRCVLINSERDKGYQIQLEAALTGCVGEAR